MQSLIPWMLAGAAFVVFCLVWRVYQWWGREEMSNLRDDREFRAWDAEQKKKIGVLNSLRFFKKTNSRWNYVLISQHWPHLLCWQWSLWWRPPLKTKDWFWFWWKSYRYPGGGCWLSLSIGPFGNFTYTRQAYDYMANIGTDAPEIKYYHDDGINRNLQ